LPEDDGQRQLRLKLSELSRVDISERERAQRMHAIMTEKWTASQNSKNEAAISSAPTSPTLAPLENGDGEANPYKLLPGDDRKTYYTGPGAGEGGKEEELGCSHYRRGVRLQCSTCERWHTCRFCHDEAEDHALIRRETKNMLCMHCGKPQPAKQDCGNCGVRSAKYYCDKCKLWDDDPHKSIYHCNDCGICRIGQGLGKDFFHCKKCGVCMSIALEGSHRCIERSTECDCPICGEFMFTSTQTVVFMTCGHSIHHKCYYEHMKTSYRCPTCARTIINMESQFRQLDVEIDAQPLPTPYDRWRCLISCNDCTARSNVPFHFLGLRCENCRSYNTSQLKILRPEDGVDTEGNVVASGGVPSLPTSPLGIERVRSIPVIPVLHSPPRAAGTEHGNALETFSAGRAISPGVQVATGPIQGVDIQDDGWGSEEEDDSDFLSERDMEDEDEDDDGLDMDLDEEEEEEEDDEEEEELINLRGHI
ncbi:zinc-ribbon-domain-containing protein, partial [Pyronema omphalodes]